MKFKIVKLSPFEKAAIGILIHSIGLAFSTISKPVCYSLCGIGIFLFFYGFIVNRTYTKPFQGNATTLYLFFLFWTVLIIVRPFINSDPIEGFSPVDKYQILSFILPLFLIIPNSVLNFNFLFKIAAISGIIGLFFLVALFKEIYSSNLTETINDYQTYIWKVGIPVYFLSVNAFMVLFRRFLTRKQLLFSFICLTVVIVTLLFAGRRGALSFFILILLGAFLLDLKNSNRSTKKIYKISLIVLFFLIGVKIYLLYSDTTFALFTSRLTGDTRSEVEFYFFKSFKSDLQSWIFGRGLNGAYFCPIFEDSNRGIIETGYLFLILKGGIIYLLFYVAFLAYTAFLGFYRTNNNLTKGMAIFLVIHLLYLYPFGVPSFDLEYFLVWMFVPLCYSRNLRLKTDAEIKNKMKNNINENPVVYEHTVKL